MPEPINRRAPLGNMLVAVDFSTASQRAVARAAALPLGERATLTLLHVLPRQRDPVRRTQAENAAQRQLSDAAAVAASVAAANGRPGARIATRVVHGAPFIEIIQRARAARAELVVLGRHGHHTFKSMLLGSTAERVLRKGDLPVLIVLSSPAVPYRRPLAALDGSPAASAALQLAWRMVGPRVTSIDAVHAYQVLPDVTVKHSGFTDVDVHAYRAGVRRQAKDEMAGLLAEAGDAGVHATAIVARGDARSVILGAAARHRSDLLAVGTHGRSGVAHLLLGSVAESVIREARCDVLVLRAPDATFELP